MYEAEEEKKLSATAERFCRRFSLDEIQSATADFSEAHLIGIGGFGKVYKAQINDGEETVAIKRLALNSNQGEQEFLMEIETLSKLRHLNLVSLIGYCNDNGEMILVYEYINLGTLADNLYSLSRNNHSSSLTWMQRLNICIGAARGLDYLHTGTSIIHRDVKSTNILLDGNFTAKVSDFGLAKHLSSTNPRSHISTVVKGSFGYLDPSYFTTCRLTKHSDTYAFGVVLLEVLCGRPAVDSRLGEDEMSLVMWAQDKISKGKVDDIVASNIRDEIVADCLKTFVGIAKKCLNHDPKKRPTMSQVVAKLEFAVEQQDKKAHTLNASPFRPFWSRVKPSGGRATEPSTIPATTQEEASKDKHTTVEEVDESMDKLDVNVWSDVAPAIPINELKEITHNFSSVVNGSGGRVYHGVQKSGQVAAIKRIHRCLPDNEFLAQVSIAFSLKHENVVQLLGYCLYGGHQFLAYEFAQNGSLHDILHGNILIGPVPFLSWAKRVRIAIGIAEGLKYIHDQGQIHCNIKSRNILLFDDYQVAKLADFGQLPQIFYDKGFGDYHPSAIDQFRGYLAPEVHNRYTRHRTLRWSSDVYSFGVVLVKLLTGGKIVNYERPLSYQHIVTWARPWLGQDKVNKIADARLNGDYPPKDVAKMGAIAALCLQETADDRPDMGIIIKALRPLLKATAH